MRIKAFQRAAGRCRAEDCVGAGQQWRDRGELRRREVAVAGEKGDPVRGRRDLRVRVGENNDLIQLLTQNCHE